MAVIEHCRECIYHIDPSFDKCPAGVKGDFCGHPKVDKEIKKPFKAKNCPHFTPMDKKNMRACLAGKIRPTWKTNEVII